MWCMQQPQVDSDSCCACSNACEACCSLLSVSDPMYWCMSDMSHACIHQSRCGLLLCMQHCRWSLLCIWVQKYGSPRCGVDVCIAVLIPFSLSRSFTHLLASSHVYDSDPTCCFFWCKHISEPMLTISVHAALQVLFLHILQCIHICASKCCFLSCMYTLKHIVTALVNPAIRKSLAERYWRLLISHNWLFSWLWLALLNL